MNHRQCQSVIVLCALFFRYYSVCGQTEVKGSLTFVIDTTESMRRDIASVRYQSDKIFEAILKSNESQIEKFVLVTFSDPDYTLLINTTNKDEFKRSLDSITTTGGGDCPEMAMSGILLGLQSSYNFSYIFVFTDAPAKDAGLYEKVKNLALDLNVKITFLMTKTQCEEENENDFKIYGDLAVKTGGEFFRVTKNNLKQLLDYTAEMVRVRKTEIIKREFLASEVKKVNVTVDSGIEAIDVSVTGKRPSIFIKDRYGNEVRTQNIVDITEAKVVTLENRESGLYDVEVECDDNTLVTIYGSSKVSFQYGYAAITPSSLNDTTNRPVAGQNSILAIQLKTNKKKLKLRHIQLLNLKGDVIHEHAMINVNEDDQFYISEPFVSPNDTFKIAIVASDEMTDESVKRISPPIEPQVILEPIENKAPKVSIIGESRLMSSYGQTLLLKCSINGYPAPKTVWQDESGTLLTSKTAIKKIPYEFISVLEINNITTNNTFNCKASNDLGSDKKSVTVEVKTFFKVVDISKDKVVEYNKKGTLHCKVNASPPVNITWYQNGKEMKIDNDINFSPDNSTLIINKMKPKMAGKIICEIRNGMNRKIYNMKLSITGIDAPSVDKKLTQISVSKDASVNIPCRILKGNPKPTVQWFFQSDTKTIFHRIPHENNEILHIESAKPDMIGTYKCIARNEIAKDTHIVDLLIEYAPIIKESNNESINYNIGQTVIIPCSVKGAPTPNIMWFRNNTLVMDAFPYRIYRNKTLRFEASVKIHGLYTCQASNKFGTVKKTVNVNVCDPADINIPEETTLKIKVGSKSELACEVKGYPMPTMKWFFFDKNYTKRKQYKPNEITSSGTLVIPVVQLDDEGFYICAVENSCGRKNLTYTIQPNAPPMTIPTKKNFDAVVDDRILKIPCSVTGEPKPIITWKKDGNLLVTGTEWYSVTTEGALIIKNIKSSSKGTYTCMAKNDYGVAYGLNTVIVRNYPIKAGPLKIMYIEENQTKEIECNVPCIRTNEIRWYKVKQKIAEGRLVLANFNQKQEGRYKCHVSNLTGTYTGSIQINLGEKPRFINNVTVHTYYFDDMNYFDCINIGKPKTKTTWRFNKNKIDVSVMDYYYENKISSIGEYTCVVENNFGKIERTFNLTTCDCLLNIQNDFDIYHPLVLTETFRLPNFKIKDEHLAIPINETVQFFCPGEFNKFSNTEIKAVCMENYRFNVKGTFVDYPKLKCKEPLQAIKIKMDKSCDSYNNGDFYQIGFNVKEFLEIYRICFHKVRKVPLYAEYTLIPSAAGVKSPPIETWLDSEIVKYNQTEMYDCKKQKDDLSSILDKQFQHEESWCFTAKQLVNEKDVIPGFAQMLTHSYLNFIPYWSSGDVKNWDKCEEILRSTTKMKDKYLLIRTGISQKLELPSKTSGLRTVHIADKAGNKNLVPMFLWKVITDVVEGASVAIIHLNIPDLSWIDVNSYIICPNICDRIDWLKDINTDDINNGFIYCCSIFEFEKAFKYRYVFSKGYGRLLKTL